MDKESLRLVIVDQSRNLAERLGHKDIIGREGNPHAYIKHPTALVILGVRRAGKSTLAAQLFYGRKFGYINFDDERLLEAKTEDLNTILQLFYELYGVGLENIVLDEPQQVRGWELFVSRLRDTKKVVVTGSSSRLLSSELSTYLTGRHIDVLLFPFSFHEYLAYRKYAVPAALSTSERAEIFKMFEEYVLNGGFPERFTLGAGIVRNIYEDIVTKDVLLRHKIKHITDLRQIARFLVANSASEFTYASLRGISRVKSVITISNWVRYLEEAYLIFVIERFSYKLKERVLAPKKAYCVDNGILNSMTLEASENRGRLMENIVALQLLRRRGAGSECDVFYWKDHQGREVDFVTMKKGSIQQLVQVTFASSREAVEERETDSLARASEELKCKNLLVLTWDYEGREKRSGKTIKFTPLWKWLLSKE